MHLWLSRSVWNARRLSTPVTEDFFALLGIYLIKCAPHQVNGTGPLAGLYELTNSEEPRCK